MQWLPFLDYVLECADEAHELIATSTIPSLRVSPTPFAASEIEAILQAEICYNDITIDQCGGADPLLVMPTNEK